MTPQDVLKKVFKLTGNTQADVASKMGLSGQGAISQFFQSKNMRLDSLLGMLNVCGYELVARSADGKNQEFVIGDRLSEEGTTTDERRLEELVRRMVSEELTRRFTQSGSD